MINFKPTIRINEANKQGKCNIKIRLSYQGKTRYIKTKYSILPELFNNETGKVKNKYPNFHFINLELSRIISDYEMKVISIKNNIDINSLLLLLRKEKEKSIDFYHLAKLKAKNAKINGKFKTFETYQGTINKLKLITRLEILEFNTIDIKFLKHFEQKLKQQGIKTNSIGIHLRNIRAVYNDAIDENIIGLEFYPFRKFKIAKELTAKRSLTIDQLSKIKNTGLKKFESYARDIFMLSFYFIGINFKDLYYLTEIKNKRIEYRRFKTGKLYSIEVIPAAMQIVEANKGNQYLLNCFERYVNHAGFTKEINKFLKRVAILTGINEPLTSYYARHTWATIAAGLDIPKETISAALGHEIGSQTTGIYIDFDRRKVDQANLMVFNAITSYPIS
jgi:integrase